MHFIDAKGILTGSSGHCGMNIYRGCTHGCIYCDSRSRCYQFTHAFEDVEVKQNAPELLKKALRSKLWLAPILPFINDNEENISMILNECVRTGVKGIICFGMGMTLREGDREYYYAALDKHFPGFKERYIKLYGNAYEVPSPNSRELMKIFKRICQENGMMGTPEECFEFMRTMPDRYTQMSLFDNIT